MIFGQQKVSAGMSQFLICYNVDKTFDKDIILQNYKKMIKHYSTQITNEQNYPFRQKNFLIPNFEYEVRIRLPLKLPFQYRNYNKNIKKITDLQILCGSLIKLKGVIQQRTQNQFILIYEQIPYSLHNIVDLKIQFQKIQMKILNLCQFLLQKRIVPEFDVKYFGLNQSKQLKYLLLPGFEQIFDQSQLRDQFGKLSSNVKNMIKKLDINFPISPGETVEDDKTSQRISERDLSAYNKRFQQKISLIESKLLLVRGGINQKLSSSQKLKRKKKMSQNFTQESASISSSSSNQMRINESKTKQFQGKMRQSYKNQRQKEYSKTENDNFYKTSKQASKQNSFQQENDQQNRENKKVMKSSKLTNSLIIEEKKLQMQKLKHHKSSFGDYSNYGNQSQKQTKLKKRISSALQKSKYALKVYQKYQFKRNNLIGNSKKT